MQKTESPPDIVSAMVQRLEGCQDLTQLRALMGVPEPVPETEPPKNEAIEDRGPRFQLGTREQGATEFTREAADLIRAKSTNPLARAESMAAAFRATKKKEILSKKRQAITTAEYLERDSKVKPPEPEVIFEEEEKKADDLPELSKQHVP